MKLGVQTIKSLLRFLIFTIVIFGLGFVWAKQLGHSPGDNFAIVWITSGFLSVTLFPIMRLMIPDFRERLSAKWTYVLFLCCFLLVMQIIATIGSLGMGGHSRLWTGGSGLFKHKLYLFYLHKQLYWTLSWILIYVLSCLAISKLWAAKAYEIALSSALFWFWVATYFITIILWRGLGWGISFFGRVWES